MVFAQTSWQFIDQLNGTGVQTIYLLNEDIFVGTYQDGIYQFNNTENIWKKNIDFPEYRSVYGFTSNSFGDIFATALYYVYKSTDGGLSWSNFNLGYLISTFGRDSLNNIIYAGGAGIIYKSFDDGDNWISDTLSEFSHTITCIETDYNGNVYVGTWGGGLFFSTNNGSDWKKVLIDTTSDYITALKIHNNNIFAGIRKIPTGSAYGVLFNSSDQGNTWSKLYSFGEAHRFLHISSIELDNNDNIYVSTSDHLGLYKSTNGGNSFFKINSYPYKGVNFIKYFNFTNILYTGTNGAGVIISSDYGETWEESNKGMHNLTIDNITMDLDDNIFVGSDRTEWSIYMSTNYGFDWSNTALHNGWGYLYGLDSDKNGRILAAINDNLYRFKNEEKEWETIYHKSVMHNLNSDRAGDIYLSGNQFVLKTTDGGNSFQILTYPYPYHPFQVISDSIENLYMSTERDVNGDSFILKSTNDGYSWGVIFSVENSRINDIDIDVQRFLYVATEEKGLYQSKDNGQTWQTIIPIDKINCYQ